MIIDCYQCYCWICLTGLDDPPDIKDVLLYANHSDPQLRGHTTVIIGNFISSVLVEGRGDFTKWIQQTDSAGNSGKKAVGSGLSKYHV